MKFKPGHTATTNGRIGKISSMPLVIRNEINRRLDDGHSPKEIADWLNTHEEARKVMAEKWHGLPIYRHAIARWQRGGYQQWRKRHEQIENLKELSEHALKLGQAAGGSISDGSAAIAGGKIMDALESATGEDVEKIVRAINGLRAGDLTKLKIAQGDKKIAQVDRRLDRDDKRLELERKKMQRDHTELFLKWYADKKARDIVESRDGNAEKIERLGRAMFGEAW